MPKLTTNSLCSRLASNDWSLRKMGFRLWKWTHRLVYVAAIVLFYHQGTSGKGNWQLALNLFVPVATLETIRVSKRLATYLFSRFQSPARSCVVGMA